MEISFNRQDKESQEKIKLLEARVELLENNIDILKGFNASIREELKKFLVDIAMLVEYLGIERKRVTKEGIEKDIFVKKK